MSYNVWFDPRAEEDLAKITRIDRNLAQRIVSKIKYISENSHDINHVSLRGKWEGFFRYRVGDYRIIYQKNDDDEYIEICFVGHRKEIYKQ